MYSYKRKSLGMAVMLGLGFAVAQGASAQSADCEYVIVNEWGGGAQADIRITNTGSTTFNGWTVGWTYDTNSMSASWNANVSGNNPYSASDVGWNETVGPGETVSFGVQVNANGGDIETPAITGDVCNDSTSSSSSSSSSSSEASESSSSSESSVSSSSSSDASGAYCNWYGTGYPLCESTQSGWGWEDNQSCIAPSTCSAQPDPYGIVSGSSSSSSSSSSSDVSSSESSSSSSVSSSSSSSADAGGIFRVNAQGNITKNGEEMPMHCGAWFGLEGQHEPEDAENNAGGAPMELYVGNMWWADTGRTIQQTMNEITAQGINVVRLPIAPQTLDPNNPQGIGDIRQGGVLKNHESVRQENARQALEEFITLADQNNIEVIIDIHSCSNYVGWRAGRLDATPPWTDATRDNYEFTREGYSCGPVDDPSVTVHEYNETLWLEDLREIAGLPEQLGVDNILAIDIFNEPWDYTWEEWSTLAESAYQAIDSVNSDVLVMVEGIGSVKSDGTEIPHGDEATNPNWGENLFPFANDPLDIPKERLILSPHTYGPSVFVQNHFLDPSQPGCEDLEGDAAGDAGCNIVIDPNRLEPGWEEHFGYLKDQGYAVVIGEFGGHWEWPNGAPQRDQDRWSHITPGVDAQWQNALVDYMIERDVEGCYWSINPESGDTGGLYVHEYDPISNESGWGTWLGLDPNKWDLLDRLWAD